MSWRETGIRRPFKRIWSKLNSSSRAISSRAEFFAWSLVPSLELRAEFNCLFIVWTRSVIWAGKELWAVGHIHMRNILFSLSIKDTNRVEDDTKASAWWLRNSSAIPRNREVSLGKKGVRKGTVKSMFLDLWSLTLKYILHRSRKTQMRTEVWMFKFEYHHEDAV